MSEQSLNFGCCERVCHGVLVCRWIHRAKRREFVHGVSCRQFQESQRLCTV